MVSVDDVWKRRERGNETALAVHHPSIATNHLPAMVRPFQLVFSIEQRAVERDKSKVVPTVNGVDRGFHPTRTHRNGNGISNCKTARMAHTASRIALPCFVGPLLGH